MGNVKAVPVVGEAVTVIESGTKIVAAGFIAPFDGDEAEKLAKGAGDAWVEYSEKNVIVGPINSGIRYVAGDEKGAKRVIKSTGNALESVADSTPVVGHVKGLVHYAMDDDEHGHQCMIGASRTTAVLAAGAVTGGLGGGLVAGGLAGVGTGVIYDGGHSVIDSAVNDDRRTHGIWNIDEDFKNAKSANDALSAELSVFGSLAGDFLAGSGAAETTKQIIKARKIKTQQNTLKRAFKEKAPEVDPNIATKETVKAARNLDKHMKDGTVKRDGHVSTRVRNTETGDVHQGYSSLARADINHENFKTNGPEKSGFKSKTQARKPAKSSTLMEQNPDVKPSMSRNPATCAEHDAFNSFYKNASEGSAKTCAETYSVMFKNGVYNTVVRCKNCLSYAEAMGKVVTDKVSGVGVPVARITPHITTACKCGALAVGTAVHLKNKKN